MRGEGSGSDNIEERPVNGVLTNARLRRRPRDGEPEAIQMGEMKLGRWLWVGGRLYVDDDELRFAGTETVMFEDSLDRMRTGPTLRYAVAVQGDGIESVHRRRGVVGVPYVSLTTTDGAQLQLRAGVAGSKSDLIIETVQALIDASAAGSSKRSRREPDERA